MITMASKRRVRQKACMGKKRYTTRDEAERHVDRVRDHSFAHLQVYKCSFGDHWHVGHPPLTKLEFPDYGKEKH